SSASFSWESTARRRLTRRTNAALAESGRCGPRRCRIERTADDPPRRHPIREQLDPPRTQPRADLLTALRVDANRTLDEHAAGRPPRLHHDVVDDERGMR